MPKAPAPAADKVSDWVVLDITSFTKTTNRDKVLKILKSAGMTVTDISDPYMNTARFGKLTPGIIKYTFRNKQAISITVKRTDYETKTPEYPGN
jgi:hypothetical protein